MFEPRLALASLSGQADAQWAIDGARFAGMAFLGGLAIDERTRAAARRMVETRDRSEFLPESPFEFLDQQLSKLVGHPIHAGVNVRAVRADPLRRAASICVSHDAVLELNAHCRQDELTALGTGQALLRNPTELREQIRIARAAGATVSVKVRAEVPGVSLPDVSATAVDAGAAILHVDAMDSESVIEAIVDRTDAFVIANNGVRDRETVAEYLDYGADAVSVGRPSDDPVVLERVHRALSEIR